MVPVLELWLPILLSAVLVHIVSFVIHVVLPYHRTDYAKVAAEDDVMAALRRFNIPPGNYVMPHAGSAQAMREPGYAEKRAAGPVAFLTVLPSGPTGMGAQLVGWFIFSVVVSIFAAYIAGRALDPGAAYAEVFRFTGTVAFVGYALADWTQSIWWGRKWSTTLKNTLDGLIYALLTAGVFGWLWPS